MTKLLGTIVVSMLIQPIWAQQVDKKTTDSIRNLPPLEVKAVRLSEQAPFAKTNLSKNQIARRFNITNVSAFINDIRRKGINVRLTTTRTGNTAYTI